MLSVTFITCALLNDWIIDNRRRCCCCRTIRGLMAFLTKWWWRNVRRADDCIIVYWQRRWWRLCWRNVWNLQFCARWQIAWIEMINWPKQENSSKTNWLLSGIFISSTWATYPSWFTSGFNVCGSIKTLPFGTLAISVTAQTIPDETDDGGSGVWFSLP